MTDILQRTRSALRAFAQAWRGAPAPASGPAGPPPPALPGLTFADANASAADPSTWLAVFETAVTRGVPVSRDVLVAIRDALDAPFPTEADRARFVKFLRPRPGLAVALAEMREAGLLGRLFPALHTVAGKTVREVSHASMAETHSLVAIEYLERLPSEATLAGERFGAMLRELQAPELLVLALLVHHVGASKHEHNVEEAARLAGDAVEVLQLANDARQMVTFLVSSQTRMAQVAFRQDAGDPDVVVSFASLLSAASLFNTFNTEEHLRMLALLTLADLGALGADVLTPWKSELLWRLFVDTYNHLTMAYGDEVIDRQSAARTILQAKRPADMSEAELVQFLEGLPTRYLTLFEPDTIYEHVRLWRNMGQDDVHFFLQHKPEAWELTVVTLDRPFLFANICGVLSYFGMNILRGYAFTSSSSLVLDVFQFADSEGFFNRQEAETQFNARLSDVVAGRFDIAEYLRGREAKPGVRRAPPVIYFDNEASRQYTVLELVADDAPGLLYRISQAVSRQGLSVELVLISTEGEKAIDVFHLKKGGNKLSDSDQLALTEDLERTLDEAYGSR